MTNQQLPLNQNEWTLADHWRVLQASLDFWTFEWHVNSNAVVSLRAPGAELSLDISIHDYRQVWHYISRYHLTQALESDPDRHSQALESARERDPDSQPSIGTRRSGEDDAWKWYQEPEAEGYLCKVISTHAPTATARIEIPFYSGTKSLFKTVPAAALSEVPESSR